MISPEFFKMAECQEPYTRAEWARVMGLEQYQFNTPVMFSLLTGVPVERIKLEVDHESTQATDRHDRDDGGTFRDL